MPQSKIKELDELQVLPVIPFLAGSSTLPVSIEGHNIYCLIWNCCYSSKC